MNRRRPCAAAVAVAAAVVLALGARPDPARAASLAHNGTGTAKYRLTSDSNLPAPASDASGPQVILDVTNGQIVPPSKSDGTTSSPLTILSTSSGLDQNNLIVGLKDVTAGASGSPSQLFGLSFFKNGLQSAGGKGQLDFELNVNPALPTPTLTPEGTGLHIASLDVAPPVQLPPPSTPDTSKTTTTTTTTTSASTPPNQQHPNGAQVPEPASLALWSALAGVGLLRARSLRRRGRGRRAAAG